MDVAGAGFFWSVWSFWFFLSVRYVWFEEQERQAAGAPEKPPGSLRSPCDNRTGQAGPNEVDYPRFFYAPIQGFCPLAGVVQKELLLLWTPVYLV